MYSTTSKYIHCKRFYIENKTFFSKILLYSKLSISIHTKHAGKTTFLDLTFFFKTSVYWLEINLAWEGLVCRSGYYLYHTVTCNELCQLELVERVYWTLLRIVSYCHRITVWKCPHNLTNYCLPGKDFEFGEFWLSGSDLGRTGHYVWMTTGKSVDHNALSVGQPNNVKEHCVKMMTNGNAIFYFKYPCHSTLYYICESQEDKLDIRK